MENAPVHHAVLHDPDTGRWMDYGAPRAVIATARAGDVRDALAAVEDAVERRGLHAAGYIAYEAAPAFDPALAVRDAGGFPLLWFGLFDAPRPLDGAPAARAAAAPAPDWRPAIPRDEYDRAFRRIKFHIGSGDIYQANYSFRLRAPFAGDAWDFFAAHLAAQRPAFGAWLAAGDHAVCSASPELFFALDGARIVSRPMKGTRPRGRFAAEDAARAAQLRAAEKDRAENVMIVDMVRNDLGRIARAGSVRVPRLFDVEMHGHVLQMTSTVEAETTASFAEIVAALFPAASITGAPKARSMQIIAETESSPRGVYTGALGFLAPGRRARFSVAIRTVQVDTAARTAEYGVGGGIVWDSRGADEYEECVVKSRVLSAPAAPFELVETLRWTPAEGFARLDAHLARMASSAAHFGLACDPARARGALAAAAAAFPAVAHRVRLLSDADGNVRVAHEPLDGRRGCDPRRVALAAEPVSSADVFLFHKTTRRDAYERARAARPGYDDVLLFNERGELTESLVANVAVEIGGQLCTPPVTCGLLAGVERAALLAGGAVRERVITVEELLASPRVILFNSVRGTWEAEVDAATAAEATRASRSAPRSGRSPGGVRSTASTRPSRSRGSRTAPVSGSRS